MAPVMMGAYVSNDRGNDYLHYPHDAFFLATCQKSGNLIYIAIFSWHLSFVIRCFVMVNGHSVKLCHILPQHWWSIDHIWLILKTLSHAFYDTDDPTTIYGRFWILAIEYFCVAQELIRFDVRFLSFILVKWRSNKILASVGLTQAYPD